jgi:hypothetical protein
MIALLATLFVTGVSVSQAGPAGRVRDKIGGQHETRNEKTITPAHTSLTPAEKNVLRYMRNHPIATSKGLEKAQNHPEAAIRVIEFARDHPGIVQNVAQFADNHPGIVHHLGYLYLYDKSRPSPLDNGESTPTEDEDEPAGVTYVYYPTPFYYPYPYYGYPAEGSREGSTNCSDYDSCEKSAYASNGDLLAAKPQQGTSTSPTLNVNLFRRWLIAEWLPQSSSPGAEQSQSEKWLRLVYPGEAAQVKVVTFFTADEKGELLDREEITTAPYSAELRVDRLTAVVGLTIQYRDDCETTLRFPLAVVQELISSDGGKKTTT